MDNLLDRIKTLDNNKLIDVVKNFKQYGYGVEVKNEALKLLANRGVDMESLTLSGQLENQSYKTSERHYKSFTTNSRVAFSLYALLLIILLFSGILEEILGWFLLVIDWILFFSYIVSLIKSFLDDSNFYKSIGKDYGISNAFVYVFIGMHLYGFLYFYTKKRMKEELNQIT